MELDGTIMRGSVTSNRVKLFYSCEKQPLMSQVQHMEDLSSDSDELGLGTLANNDDEYLPSNTASYIRNPNWLTSYKEPPPDWQARWDRWKNCKKAQLQQTRGSPTGENQGTLGNR